MKLMQIMVLQYSYSTVGNGFIKFFEETEREGEGGRRIKKVFPCYLQTFAFNAHNKNYFIVEFYN